MSKTSRGARCHLRVKSGWVKLFHFIVCRPRLRRGPLPLVQPFGPTVPFDPATWPSPAPCIPAGSRGLIPLQIGSWFVASRLLQVEGISQGGVGVTQK
jgi:hypothetical protein